MCDLIKKGEFYLFLSQNRVSLFMSEWIEIPGAGVVFTYVAVSLFTSEWVEIPSRVFKFSILKSYSI